MTDVGSAIITTVEMRKELKWTSDTAETLICRIWNKVCNARIAFGSVNACDTVWNGA